jgi:transcriptional regulator
MYIPKLYRNDSLEEVADFLKNNGFAILVSQVNGRLWGTHIPLLTGKNKKGEDILHGHISKANPQWKSFNDGEEVLAIFMGPHAYVSSSWYEHENVPTWNYIAVHVYGAITIYDESGLLDSLTKLVDTYESSSERPVSVAGMSPETLKENLSGVVGFEIVVKEVHSAKKLSQNRDDKDHENIIKQLEKTGDAPAKEIAKEMYKNRNPYENNKSQG